MAENVVPMQCTHCHLVMSYSPLRLGRKCGSCKMGTWIPYNGVDMKDKTGKEINREFAPVKRDPNDKYKIRIVEGEPEYEVTKDGNRPVVKKK